MNLLQNNKDHEHIFSPYSNKVEFTITILHLVKRWLDCLSKTRSDGKIECYLLLLPCILFGMLVENHASIFNNAFEATRKFLFKGLHILVKHGYVK